MSQLLSYLQVNSKLLFTSHYTIAYIHLKVQRNNWSANQTSQYGILFRSNSAIKESTWINSTTMGGVTNDLGIYDGTSSFNLKSDDDDDGRRQRKKMTASWLFNRYC